MDENLSKEDQIKQLTVNLDRVRDETNKLIQESLRLERELALLMSPFEIGDVIEGAPGNEWASKGKFVVVMPKYYTRFSVQLVTDKLKKDGTISRNRHVIYSPNSYVKVGHMELPNQ